MTDGRHRVREVHVDSFDSIPDVSGVSESSLSEEDVGRVQAAMMGLKDDEFEVVVTVAQGSSFVEAAELLGKTAGWVRQKFLSGQRRMVAELGDLFE